jgi:hypothetical protein
MQHWIQGALLLAGSVFGSRAHAAGLPASAVTGTTTAPPETEEAGAEAGAGATSPPAAEQPAAKAAAAEPPPPLAAEPEAAPAIATGTPAAAETAAPSAARRAGIGLLAAAGLHSGFGLGARLGVGDVGLELTGGYQLLYAVWDGRGGAQDRKIDLGSSAQFGSELYFTPWHPGKTSAVGLKSGYRYNSVLEHGFAVAIAFLATLSPHLAFEGLAGAQVFPGSEGRLRRKLELPNDADIVYGSQTQFFEYGFQLIWYP